MTPLDRYNAAFEQRPAADAALTQALAVVHPNTALLVVRFAAAMAEKLARAEAKYGYGDSWADDGWEAKCAADLHEHLRKGDPRDVAAYCAFLWHHGWSTIPPVLRPFPGEGETDQ